jgi:hypothetical protein
VPRILSNSTYTFLVMIWLMVTGWYGWLIKYGLLNVNSSAMSSGLVSIFPCLSLSLSSVVFSVF